MRLESMVSAEPDLFTGNPFLAGALVTVDSHTAGEATRLVVGGLPPIPGDSVAAKRRYVAEHLDHVRLLLTREPRGHRDIFGAIVTAATSADGDFGLIYMDARRYPYMCGHATIGAITTLLEMGWVPVTPGAAEQEVVVDTPSGPVCASARLRWENGAVRVASVAMQLMPSFVQATDQTVTVPGVGTFRAELVCVGGTFIMVSADQIAHELSAVNAPALAELGMALIAAGNEQLAVRHPTRPDVNTIDVAEFYAPHGSGNSRSAVVYGEAHVDRSPCGTGTAAKLALFHHQGLLAPGDELVSEGLLGTTFIGRIVRETTIGDLPAIVPEIRGSAHITGLHRFVVRPDDPFAEGFLF
ncbi:MAG: proline racemase family protein [Anaerolineae bacterium]|nr:proline racemase family protein [Anaerolineae bacterium]